MATAKKFNTTFKDTYQEVTDSVIKTLEEGTVIWKCPWNKTGLPKNVSTGVNYRGWNIFWLNFHTISKGYRTPYYITYKQASDLGGTIKKGEKGTKITYWATIELKDKQFIKKDSTTNDHKEEHPVKMVPKDHIVFNVDQTERINFADVEKLFRNESEEITSCEDVIARMPSKPIITEKGNRAYYSPGEDLVAVPCMRQFNSDPGYYAVLFHELAHSTGHQSRLNRKGIMERTSFGDSDYSKEELTAELTSAFLCAVTDIGTETLPASAAYIASWLLALKNDKTLVLKAAAQAQKAADYILNVRSTITT